MCCDTLFGRTSLGEDSTCFHGLKTRGLFGRIGIKDFARTMATSKRLLLHEEANIAMDYPARATSKLEYIYTTEICSEFGR